MCLAVAEALAVGTPVVATWVGGVPCDGGPREDRAARPARQRQGAVAAIRSCSATRPKRAGSPQRKSTCAGCTSTRWLGPRRLRSTSGSRSEGRSRRPGAAAEFFHLPALASVLTRNDVWLVDRDAGARLRRSRAATGGGSTCSRTTASSPWTAAIVAAPNDAHASVAIIWKQTAVLCEKPLARTAAEAQSIVDAADRAPLAVGMFRRLLASTKRVAEQLAEEPLGRPVRFRAEEVSTRGARSRGSRSTASAPAGA